MEIHLSRQQLDGLRDAAVNAWPVEACALLSGRWSDNGVSVKRIFQARNIDNSPVSFQLDPVELISIYSKVEEAGEEIVGIFHCHPAPPSPSFTDLRFMKLNPVVWIIMSMPSEAYAGYIWRNDKVVEVQVRVLD